jgi:hypothetical protein
MKRILLIALAVVLVVSITSVYADERVKLSGEYRVRGWYTDNLVGTSGQVNWDNNDDSNNESYFDQRFRVGTTITAAEGVTANMRFDYGEETWGARNADGTVPSNGRPTEGAELQIDRLYLRLEKDMFNFIAGEYDGAFGYTSAFETQSKWLLLRLKLPVIIDLAYLKLDEGQGTSDEDTSGLNTDDATAYGLHVAYNAEQFGAGAFVGYRQQNEGILNTVAQNDSNLTVVGVYGNFNLGMVELKGEFDYFDGTAQLKNSFTKTDLKGQQAWVYAGIKLGDKLKVPVHAVYAKGYASNANEDQAWQLAPAFGDFAPQDLDGNYYADYFFFNSSEIFDPAGTGGGVMGLMAGVDFQLNEELLLQGQVGYVQPEDSIDYNLLLGNVGPDTYSSQYWAQVGATWSFMPATDFTAIVLYTQPSYDDSAVPDDAGYGLFTKIRVKF